MRVKSGWVTQLVNFPHGKLSSQYAIKIRRGRENPKSRATDDRVNAEISLPHACTTSVYILYSCLWRLYAVHGTCCLYDVRLHGLKMASIKFMLYKLFYRPFVQQNNEFVNQLIFLLFPATEPRNGCRVVVTRTRIIMGQEGNPVADSLAVVRETWTGSPNHPSIPSTICQAKGW